MNNKFQPAAEYTNYDKPFQNQFEEIYSQEETALWGRTCITTYGKVRKYYVVEKHFYDLNGIDEEVYNRKFFTEKIDFEAFKKYEAENEN